MLAKMLEFAIGLDGVVVKWVIKKCAELGAAFFLGPFEGAVIYAMFALWGVVIALKLMGKIEVKKK
jgi:hypothetical protein